MTEASSEHSLITTAGWSLILIGLVFLLAICVHRNLQSIPADISHRVHSVLQQAGYALVTIRIDGRDVVVTGPANVADAARITDIVKSVRGVRVVSTGLTIVSSVPPAQALSNIRSHESIGGKQGQ